MLGIDEIVNMLDEEQLSPAKVTADGKLAPGLINNRVDAPQQGLVGAPKPTDAVVTPGPAMENEPTEPSVAAKPLDGSPAPSASLSSQPSATASPSFADMLMRNEGLMQQERERYAQREKENNSRKTFAAIADGLASLANLVGTAHGAINQQQTYQMPFIQQQDENDRNYYRNRIDALRQQNENIRMYQAKQDAEYDIQSLKHAQNLALQKQKSEDQRANTMLSGEYSLERTRMNNESSEKRNKESIEAANKRNAASITAANKRNADNIASREKIAADRIAQMDKQAEQKSRKGLTANAEAQKILKDAEMGVLADLKPELEANGVKLPFEWSKNWRQYVRLAPKFYEKYFIKSGWGNLGGTIKDVYDDDEDDDLDLHLEEMEEDEEDLGLS